MADEKQDEDSTISTAISRNGLLLGAFALLTTAIIAATHLNTKDLIEEQIRIAREKALLEIVPRERHDNQMLDLAISTNDQDFLKLSDSQSIFAALQSNELVALIFPAIAPDGYGGNINLLVGVNMDGSVAGVRVVEHEETPGLGDKIELKKSDWVLSFNGRSIGNPSDKQWTVKKDKGVFDQFTGATITPRAATHAVHRTLQFFAKEKDTLTAELQSIINSRSSSSFEQTPPPKEAGNE